MFNYKMVFDLITFFFGAGIVLFVTLLAWGENIRKPREQILDLEDKFKQILKVPKRDINPLLKQSKYNFTEQMNAILDLIKKKKLKGVHIDSLKEFEKSNEKRKKLEFIYKFRYFGVLILSILSFLFGILSINTGTDYIYKSFTYNGFYFSLFLIIVAAILINLIVGYFLEESFIKNIIKISDEIG